MSIFEAYYDDLVAEIEEVSISGTAVSEYLSKKYQFDGYKSLIKLDAVIVQKFSHLEFNQEEIEREFISSVEEYYRGEMTRQNSPIRDGSTIIEFNTQSDVEVAVNNYREWRVHYNKNKDTFSITQLHIEGIKDIHRRLLQVQFPSACGDFRRISGLGIQGSEVQTTHHLDIAPDLKEELHHLRSHRNHPIIAILNFYHKFLLIHPFNDGNGRVIRELTNNWLIDLGLPFVEIPKSVDLEYLKAIRKADSGDLPSFVNYFCDLVLDKI